MSSKHRYRLLTFYHFVDIARPHDEVIQHSGFVQDIWLKGRIYIWQEGISATVTGLPGQITAYKLYLKHHPLFHDIVDIDIKSNLVPEHCFEKMIVKYRTEIVSLGKTCTAQEIQQHKQSITTQDFQDILNRREDDKLDQQYVILDMRNNYEYLLGHFKGAIPANTINFKELSDHLDDYKKQFEGKKVISYCTGGIRCEKATVLMRQAGIDQVYQLDGGVVKYINSHDDGNRLGNLYTFDGRVSTQVGNWDTHTTIGRCIYSDQLTNHCENCRYSPCNARIICKPNEYRIHMWFCSQQCADQAKHSLLIKDTKRDHMDYQHMRDCAKKQPDTITQSLRDVYDHLTHKLHNKSFRSQFSQKEVVG